MQTSIFNLQVPVTGGRDVFLMNTFSDAQLIVSTDVAGLLERVGRGESVFTGEEREAIETLKENGFLVESRQQERQAVDEYFVNLREDTDQLRATVLTTLQCNFACDYCFQGDHGDYNKFAEKMSLETAQKVGDWVERELERIAPQRLTMQFFGGEPLLNLPVLYYLSERLSAAVQARGVKMAITIITNGLLMTREVVDRLLPLGLKGIKITLDGDRDTHNRMRPLRGGQETFDRIVENVRRVADHVPIAIGGNFDESSVDSFPALLDFLKEQEFADKLVGVNFKPVVRETVAPARPKGILPLVPVNQDGKPLGGSCMTAAGEGSGSACGSCNLTDKMTFLREETKLRGLPTPDGIHNGPCHVHMKHAHTIGTDGSLYACAGFTGDKTQSTGHIDDRSEAWRESALERFERLHPWKECGDCAFIPVCAGGCVAASHMELGDMNMPSCHKRSFESAVVSLAYDVASAA
jgi:uncharacterized protein